MKAGVCHARGVMSIPSARLSLKFPTLARPARPDAGTISSTRCQHACNIDQCFKSKQQTLPFLRATGACKNDRVVNLGQGHKPGQCPTLTSVTTCPLGFTLRPQPPRFSKAAHRATQDRSSARRRNSLRPLITGFLLSNAGTRLYILSNPHIAADDGPLANCHAAKNRGPGVNSDVIA